MGHVAECSYIGSSLEVFIFATSLKKQICGYCFLHPFTVVTVFDNTNSFAVDGIWNLAV